MPEDRDQPGVPEVLDAAARLLAEEGPEGLSVRRVAAAVGVSRQIVYTRFGGKPGLVDALYREGFRRLSEACLSVKVEEGDPESIFAIVRVYRRFALANKPFYRVMFGRSVAGYEPPASSREIALSLYSQLLKIVESCFEVGSLVACQLHPSAGSLAYKAWGLTHGLVSIEMESFFNEPKGGEDRLIAAVRAILVPCLKNLNAKEVESSQKLEEEREQLRAALAKSDGIEVLKAMATHQLPASPLARYLGLQLVRVDPGEAKFLWKVPGDLWTPYGTIHGGAIVAACELVGSAVFQSLLKASESVSTFDIHAPLLRPIVLDSGPLRIEAKVIHSGRRLMLADVNVFDSEGQLCARQTLKGLRISV